MLDEHGVCRIIDWDTAHHGSAEWDLSFALLTNCWLGGNTAPFHPEPFTDDELVARIRAMAEGYAADDAVLRASLELMPARARALVSLIEERSEAGEAAWIAMLDDGHATVWAVQAEYAATRLGIWLDLLFPLSA